MCVPSKYLVVSNFVLNKNSRLAVSCPNSETIDIASVKQQEMMYLVKVSILKQSRKSDAQRAKLCADMELVLCPPTAAVDIFV